MKPAYKWIFRTIAALVMIALLAGVQFVIVGPWALAFDGCTKYVPLATVESLVRWVWLIWAISLLVNLIVLIFFLWTPIMTLSRSALATLGSFAVWKIVALVADLNFASNCGQARNYNYPEKFPWVDTDTAFYLTIALWAVMVGCAVWALFTVPERSRMSPPST